MKTVYKYPIQVVDEFDLELPMGAEILHVAVQNYRPQMWALVDPDRPVVVRHFAVRGSGGPVDNHLHHLGSFLLADDTFVGHLFERTDPATVGAEGLRQMVGAAA